MRSSAANVTPQKLTSAAWYVLPSFTTRNASKEGVSFPVLVSTIAARVEKFVPAYESPPTKAVHAA